MSDKKVYRRENLEGLASAAALVAAMNESAMILADSGCWSATFGPGTRANKARLEAERHLALAATEALLFERCWRAGDKHSAEVAQGGVESNVAVVYRAADDIRGELVAQTRRTCGEAIRDQWAREVRAITEAIEPLDDALRVVRAWSPALEDLARGRAQFRDEGAEHRTDEDAHALKDAAAAVRSRAVTESDVNRAGLAAVAGIEV